MTAWWRRRRRHQHYPPPADGAPRLDAALQVLRARWPDACARGSAAAPIFLLAAGWRSGSTLLQRMVTAGGRCVVWGEPYGHAGLFEACARPLAAVTATWPHDDWLASPTADDATFRDGWIANLYPDVGTLLDAQRAYLDALFDAPARARGIERWGVKEIRLDADHARWLALLYPRARFVFLHRDPYAAYRSYARVGVWYLRWPDDPVLAPERFGEHWRRLVEGFVAGASELDALVLRYEELIADDGAAARLERHLGLPVAPASTLASLRGRTAHAGRPRPLVEPDAELERLEGVVGPLARRLGYRR